MTEKEIKTGLEQLRNCLEQIKGLLAWEQLKLQERRSDQPPGFYLVDTTDEDLKHQYSLFLATALKIHRWLDEADQYSLSKNQKAYFKDKLFKMEFQLKTLGLTERFIKF